MIFGRGLRSGGAAELRVGRWEEDEDGCEREKVGLVERGGEGGEAMPSRQRAA